MENKPFIFILTLALVAGCAKEKPMRVDPATMQGNYDVVKPHDIASRDRPVWVLPVTSFGWVKGSVRDDGTWESGRYVSHVIEQGHWATQEEAEMSGKPFVIAGEGKLITPDIGRPSRSGQDARGTAEGELNIADMQGRIVDLERKQSAAETEADTRSLLVQSAASQALALEDGTGKPPASVSRAAESGSGGIKIVAPSSIPASTQAAVTPTGSLHVTLAPKPVNTMEQVPVAGTNKTVKVYHTGNNQAEIQWNNKSYLLQFNDQEQKVVLPAKQ